MRYFFSPRIPAAPRILLVESGSRHILERASRSLGAMFPTAQFDLCTCFADLPATPVAGAWHDVWRVTDAHGLSAKLAMALRIARSRPPVAAMLMTGEPIMFHWKMAFLVLLPSKLILVNENGDFFWLDRSNLAPLRQFVGARWGGGGEDAFRGLFRILLFPLVFLFLLISGALTYLGRWMRLAWWRLSSKKST